jgi:hypothetical protein
MRLLLAAVGLARGDDPHHEVSLAVAVTDDQDPELEAQPQKDESILPMSVIRIEVHSAFSSRNAVAARLTWRTRLAAR